MYHSISNNPEPGVSPYYKLNTSPAVFRQHMQFLADHGYRTITMAQLVEILRYPQPGVSQLFPSINSQPSTINPSGTPPSANSQLSTLNSQPPPVSQLSTINSQLSGNPQLVVITFDDGFQNFYTEAYPILEQHGFTATVFLPTAFIGDIRRVFAPRSSTLHAPRSTSFECLTWPEVRELHKAGIEFGSHTVNHPELVDLDWVAIKPEISDSKSEIEQQIGQPITAFCYPYAYPQANHSFINTFTALLAEAGYTCCTTTQIGRVQTGNHLYGLRRLPANSLDDPALLHAKLDGAYDWLALPQAAIKRLKSIPRSSRKQDGLPSLAAPSAMN
jgi:peptidoglycan/xylan/chitin deacetylase (PgdA/CDA1 family)